MRYERLTWDVSTISCAALLEGLGLLKDRNGAWGFSQNAVANAELHNIANELRSRLQRRDQDPQATIPEPDLTGGIEL